MIAFALFAVLAVGWAYTVADAVRCARAKRCGAVPPKPLGF